MLFAEEHPGLWAMLIDPSTAAPGILAARREAHDAIVTGALELLSNDLQAAIPDARNHRIGMDFILGGAQSLVRYRLEHPGTTRDEVLASLIEVLAGLAMNLE